MIQRINSVLRKHNKKPALTVISSLSEDSRVRKVFALVQYFLKLTSGVIDFSDKSIIWRVQLMKGAKPLSMVFQAFQTMLQKKHREIDNQVLRSSKRQGICIQNMNQTLAFIASHFNLTQDAQSTSALIDLTKAILPILSELLTTIGIYQQQENIFLQLLNVFEKQQKVISNVKEQIEIQSNKETNDSILLENDEKAEKSLKQSESADINTQNIAILSQRINQSQSSLQTDQIK